jgi:hypothetical protein
LRAGVLCLAAAFGAPPLRQVAETGSAFSAVLATVSLVLCGVAATLLWIA